MLKHYRYKVTLINNNTINFKSKIFIDNASCLVIKGETYLHFEDVKTYINVEHIKKLTVNGVNYSIGYYQVN